MKRRTTSYGQPVKQCAKPGFRCVVLCLLLGQALAANPEDSIYPRLQNLSNRQQEALQREQQIDLHPLSTPKSRREERHWHQRLRRQGVQQRQLQLQQRNRAVTEQQRALSLPENPARIRADDELERFRRDQEAQRLRFKIQRRGWQGR